VAPETQEHPGHCIAAEWDESMQLLGPLSEPVFLNVYGAQELIPRNEFRQPM
jgi:hypothetical protein